MYHQWLLQHLGREGGQLAGYRSALWGGKQAAGAGTREAAKCYGLGFVQGGSCKHRTGRTHAHVPAVLLSPAQIWMGAGYGRKLYAHSFHRNVGDSLPERPAEDTEHRGRVAWRIPGEGVLCTPGEKGQDLPAQVRCK